MPNPQARGVETTEGAGTTSGVYTASCVGATKRENAGRSNVACMTKGGLRLGVGAAQLHWVAAKPSETSAVDYN